MSLDPLDVEEILAILDSTAYDELSLRTSRFTLELRRGEQGWTQELTPLGQPHLIEATDDEPASMPSASSGVATSPMGGTEHLVPVVTPIVGTFYRAPKPGAAPFVEVGDHVEPDSVVAIMETMKLMTSVPAGVAGRVAEICLGNSDFAEAGTTLMRIDPS